MTTEGIIIVHVEERGDGKAITKSVALNKRFNSFLKINILLSYGQIFLFGLGISTIPSIFKQRKGDREVIFCRFAPTSWHDTDPES